MRISDWSSDVCSSDLNSLYASYSRGYKSGGINPPLSPIFAVSESFGSETIDSFEIGSKNVFANGALQLNSTAFYYKYSGLQLRSEEHTSELQSLMRISYAVFCLTNKNMTETIMSVNQYSSDVI